MTKGAAGVVQQIPSRRHFARLCPGRWRSEYRQIRSTSSQGKPIGENQNHSSSFSDRGFDGELPRSAYQIEGSRRQRTNRGPSIWDSHAQSGPERSRTRSNADPRPTTIIICTRTDVSVDEGVGSEGIPFFNLHGLAVFPEGTGFAKTQRVSIFLQPVCWMNCSRNDIEPFCRRLYHWDLPQALQDRHGRLDVARPPRKAFADLWRATSQSVSAIE